MLLTSKWILIYCHLILYATTYFMYYRRFFYIFILYYVLLLLSSLTDRIIPNCISHHALLACLPDDDIGLWGIASLNWTWHLPFLHFRGNSLRRCHVFFRCQENISFRDKKSFVKVKILNLLYKKPSLQLFWPCRSSCNIPMPWLKSKRKYHPKWTRLNTFSPLSASNCLQFRQDFQFKKI